MMTLEQKNTINNLITLISSTKRPAVLQLIASAGSGKTYTIIQSVQKILNLFTNFRIGMITFTKKSAVEMKNRLLSCQKPVTFVGTLHALAYSIVLKKKPKLEIIKNSNEILRMLYSNMIQKEIPSLDISILPVEEKEQLNLLYQDYKKKRILFDFDDLIKEATDLCHHEQKPLFDLLIIDEFQDTSLNQIKFVISMNAPYLFCVGDSKQSIYSFRGAHVDIFYNLEQYFSNINYQYLSYNFRSQRHIVELSNQFILRTSEIFQKNMKATIKKAKKPKLYYFTKFYSIGQIWSQFYLDFCKKYTPKDTLCVLVRTNYMKQYLESLIKNFDNDIKIMTIHQSKGLEFKHVAIFGITKNNIPHHRGELNEESRLFYVALTRAEYSLSFVAWGKSHYYHQMNEIEQQFTKGDSIFLSFLIKKCQLALIS